MIRKSLITFALCLIASAFVGCGDDSTAVTQSPEAKKADEIGQDAMREAMQSKSGKSDKKASGGAAPGPSGN